MKSYFSLLIVVFALLILGAGCRKPRTAKDYSCVEYSINCELEKENILLKPIIFAKGLLDVYGEPVDTGTWYIQNKHSNALGPVFKPRVYVGINGATKGIDYSAPGQLDGIKVDTVNVACRAITLTKALIILTGRNEIVLGENHTARVVPPKQ